jgi:phenylalanine ammonia-lyase
MEKDHSSHAASSYRLWKKVQQLKKKKQSLILDGCTLDIPSVLAVAHHAICPTIRSDCGLEERLEKTVDVLNEYLSNGWIAYGVNTGFGGSADSRTDRLKDLQISLLQHTQSGIVTSLDKGLTKNHNQSPSHVMPPPWVKAAILIRANQNLRGYSAVRIEVIQRFIDLLRYDITPLVPLRGTISASGDLMPLSYIAGAAVGNSDIYTKLGADHDHMVVPASDALSRYNLQPIKLGPKEGLGLINGTAPSTALASIVIYNAQRLAVLAQLLTAMTSEGLAGNVEWANEFIHRARPHNGQIEVAANIRRFLSGSSLVSGLGARKRFGNGLWQDRYSTRTAPQWLGPYLEDMMLAQKQIEIELNSASDNPLVDVEGGSHGAPGDVYSGGNFQATSITSAMDKTRLSIQMIGRMLFAQCSELINPATNNGLDTNLVWGDPEASFTMKGPDVNMAAYMSELAALAHPVSSHVLSAEMNNQGLNSLAFISARKTMEALQILSQMCACHIFVICQAVDLRVFHLDLIDRLHCSLNDVEGPLTQLQLSHDKACQLAEELGKILVPTWFNFNNISWLERIEKVGEGLYSPMVQFLIRERLDATPAIIAETISRIKIRLREELALKSRPTSWTVEQPLGKLGAGTAELYRFVRSELGVPVHRGLIDDPLIPAPSHSDALGSKKTIGTRISAIYESIEKGDLLDMVMSTVEPHVHNGVEVNKTSS